MEDATFIERGVMKIGIVTTFSDKGYKEYGHWFVESAKKYIDWTYNYFFTQIIHI